MKKILDACCGSRMFWYDKANPMVDFCDIRQTEKITCCDGRVIEISPDIVADFRKLPFEDNSYYLVVFDPPHLKHAGEKSYMAQKYGVLNNKSWKEDIKRGFDECMRVLSINGTLIFKWNETQIKTTEIINIIGQQPLFGHKSGRLSKTQWLCFMKL